MVYKILFRGKMVCNCCYSKTCELYCYCYHCSNSLLPLRNENIIDLDEFIRTKRILHNKTIFNDNDVKQLLIENEKVTDIITYNSVEKCVINAFILKVDNDGNSYYEHKLKGSCSETDYCDLMDNIKCKLSSNKNFKLTYYIGGYDYKISNNKIYFEGYGHAFDKITMLVLSSSQFYEINLRITFLDKPNTTEEIEIHCRKYFMNHKCRTLLAQSTVKTNYFTYSEGGIFVSS